ncbi:MAG: Uma2 family endonuclease [Phototrophicaceae bacterium]
MRLLAYLLYSIDRIYYEVTLFMTIRDSFITIEDFEAFVNQPENADLLFEFINGQIHQVESRPYASSLATKICVHIGQYVISNNLGHITGKGGGYMVSGERYAPDVAFISYEKQPDLARSGYNPNPPDLAIEIISSDSSAERDSLRIKLSNYLAAGTVVWIVKPDEQVIEVHQATQAVKIYLSTDTVSGAPVLPEFELKISDIFS